MSLTYNCPSCATLLRVPDSAAGKKIRCTKCEHVFVASAEALATPPTAVTTTVPPIAMELDAPPAATTRAVPPVSLPPLVLEEAPEEFQPREEAVATAEEPRASRPQGKATNWPLILGGGGLVLFLLISGAVVGGLIWIDSMDRPRPRPPMVFPGGR